MTGGIPSVNCARARRLAADGWGLSGEIEHLVGFADFNYRITTEGGDRFVLKIAPSGTNLQWLQCQISTMLHLAASPLEALVPRVVPAKDGRVLLPVDEETDEPRWTRLITYLEGTPLAKVNHRPPALLEELGRTLASVDQALADFDHPGAHREFSWDLTTAPMNAHLAVHIDDPSRRTLVESHLERFAAAVTPRIPGLEQSVIHNDGNDYNLLISADGEDDPRLAGLIDFGDVLHTAIIAELAIACAYLMIDRVDPWSDASHLIRGYDSVRPLTRLEAEVLPDLIIGRLCTSLLFSAYGRHSNPDNEYLQISEAPMWRLLESPIMTDHARMHSAVEAACQ